jgi:hypothetical protein
MDTFACLYRRVFGEKRALHAQGHAEYNARTSQPAESVPSSYKNTARILVVRADLPGSIGITTPTAGTPVPHLPGSIGITPPTAGTPVPQDPLQSTFGPTLRGTSIFPAFTSVVNPTSHNTVP